MIYKFLVVGFLLLISASVAVGQQTYGLEKVVVKTPGGDERKLYDASWAVLIGVNDYRSWPQLSYAVADVEEMKRLLIEKLGFPEANIFTLTNREVTLENMKTLLGVTLPEWAGANDRVLIFYAGHGGTRSMPSGGDLGFLVPYDASTDDARFVVDCLSMRDIRVFANLIPAKHILFLVDACYSGLAVDASYSATDTRPFDFRFADAPIRQVITAGRAGEQVVESDDWGHIAFAYQFLQGMNSGLADTDGDGLVTGTELAGYLKPRVTRVSGNRQTPVFRPWGGEGEFVFVLNEAERLRREAEARLREARTEQEAADQARAENAQLEAEIRKLERQQEVDRQAQAEKAVYDQAVRAGTIGAFEDFVRTYPSSGYVEVAQKQIARLQLVQEQAAFDRAKSANTVGALEAFMRNYPESRFLRAARSEINDLRAREAEDARLAKEKAQKERAAEVQRKKELEARLEALRKPNLGGAQEGTPSSGDAEVGEMVYVSDFGFYIDKHEVTNAQDVGFVAARGHRAPDSVNRGSANWNTWQNGRFPPGMGNHPVVGVSFGDARAYCAWAGKRLPTDEEWEQACEGTDGRAYPWGNETPNSHLANHDEDVGKTTEVGKYPSGVSPYGALDMSGNVWEWIGSSSGSNCVIRGGAGTMLRSTCGALFATTVFLTVGATTLVFVARGINSTLIPLLPQAGGRANQ